MDKEESIMLKSMKKTSLFALVGMLSLGALATTTSSVHAAGNAPGDGTTPVVYDNRNVLPDKNGQYGMIIPTALTFTDDKQTADAPVEITGINGYDLKKDWTNLEVKATVKSANSYTLVGPDGSTPVAYNLQMKNNASPFTADDSAQEITKHFGVGGQTVTKEEGTAKLTGKAKVKGQYTDTLTYSFEEVKNDLK